MEQPPPLTPQELAEMQTAQNVSTGQPQTVKIFGILHLVFSAFGIFGIVSALVIALFGNPFLKMIPQTPELAKQAQIQAEMQEKMMPMTITTNLIGIVVTALMITAGIQLLRKKKTGLQWSNRYAIGSLIAKAIGGVLMFTVMLPLMRESLPAHTTSSGGMGAMEVGMIGGAIGGVLISAIYPILTLILLNRPNTKTWFANLPQ